MANRKLQSEIERTLKRVAEGVDVFEGIFDKIQTGISNSNTGTLPLTQVFEISSRYL